MSAGTRCLLTCSCVIKWFRSIGSTIEPVERVFTTTIIREFINPNYKHFNNTTTMSIFVSKSTGKKLIVISATRKREQQIAFRKGLDEGILDYIRVIC